MAIIQHPQTSIHMKTCRITSIIQPRMTHHTMWHRIPRAQYYGEPHGLYTVFYICLLCAFSQVLILIMFLSSICAQVLMFSWSWLFEVHYLISVVFAHQNSWGVLHVCRLVVFQPPNPLGRLTSPLDHQLSPIPLSARLQYQTQPVDENGAVLRETKQTFFLFQILTVLFIILNVCLDVLWFGVYSSHVDLYVPQFPLFHENQLKTNSVCSVLCIIRHNVPTARERGPYSKNGPFLMVLGFVTQDRRAWRLFSPLWPLGNLITHLFSRHTVVQVMGPTGARPPLLGIIAPLRPAINYWQYK